MYKFLSRRSRASVAFLLISFIPLCYWSKAIYLILTSCASILAFYELVELGVNPIKIFLYISPVFSLIISENKSLERNMVMLIVIFTQTSDVLQYIGGKISEYVYAKVIYILRTELSNFKLEFKKADFGFKSPKELSEFLQSHVKNFYIFEVSPNKTILGYIFGFWGCLIIFTWARSVLGWKTNILWFLLGCAGDLYASSIKRKYEVEDFSNFLGAHGGILDRFDSTLAVLHWNYWIDFVVRSYF